MLSRRDEAAIQTDAYIEALLSGHAGGPMLLPEAELLPDAQLRRTIDLLERGLPRIHPSFIFEQQLAGRLRRAAFAQLGGTAEPERAGLVIQLPELGGDVWPPIVLDRRLLVRGAIASGVSLAGAAVIAWRMRDRGRVRRRWLA